MENQINFLQILLLDIILQIILILILLNNFFEFIDLHFLQYLIKEN